MKKNIIYTLIVTIAILLSACGSDSKEDPFIPIASDKSDVNGYEFMNVESTLNITEYKKYKIDFQLVHDGLPEREAEVAIKAFDKSYGSVSSRYASTASNPGASISSQYVTTDGDGIGRFFYTPPANFPSEGTTFSLELVYTGIASEDSNDTLTLTQKISLVFKLDPNASNGRAATLSIVYGYKPPKGQVAPQSGGSGTNDSADLGTGDRHDPAEWDGEASKMVNYYAVHAVDEDSQRAIVGMKIKMSLVNGVKKINGNEIQNATGIIENSDPIHFVDKSANFIDSALYPSQRVESHDNLIIFPSEGKIDSSYLGGWKINTVSSDTLTLEGKYLNLENTEDLTYIIGDEKRLLGRNIAIADVQQIDLESITDEYGMAYFKVTFDPELAGHTVSLEAHGTDIDNNRVGISRIVTLRWDDFSGGPITTTNSGGMKMVPVTLSIVRPDSSLDHLIDIEIVPSSFTIKKIPHCTLDETQSNFHTNAAGQVILAINTDGNTSATGGEDDCTIEWSGGAGSMYFEY